MSIIPGNEMPVT